jgi:NADPH:quinone reductase-like Zn-dependent oxidoreductase
MRKARLTNPTRDQEQPMRAVVQDTYGSPEVLEVREIDEPVPEDNQVLVGVRAAGVDPGVWHLMTGRPYLVRIMGYGLRKPKVGIRGQDVAGRVEAVGTNVPQFRPGDEVFGIGEGSLAEYVGARADKLAPSRPTSPLSRPRPSPSPPSRPCRPSATREGFGQGRRC